MILNRTSRVLESRRNIVERLTRMKTLESRAVKPWRADEYCIVCIVAYANNPAIWGGELYQRFRGHEIVFLKLRGLR